MNFWKEINVAASTEGTKVLRLSHVVEKSIEEAIASCKSVADISTLSQRLAEEHPELRLEMEGLTEVLVARAAGKGLAVRLQK